MILKNVTKRLTIVAAVVLSLIACNDDFNDIGSSMVDHTNFDALLYDQTSLTAHSDKIIKVKSNNLSSYALGVYNDPIYGETTANVLTQLALSRENPDFGDEPELDSVVLVVPYFSTVKGQDQYGREFDLDSVFGNGSIKLSVYRSNYFLRDYDPSDNYNPQTYYTDDLEMFENNLEPDPLFENYDFKPSNEEVILVEPIRSAEGGEEMDTTKMSPQLRVKLPVDYFEDAIIDQEGTNNLQTNPNFADYFRGIYFKAEQQQDQGFFSLLNFRSDDAGINLYYKNERTPAEGEEEATYNYKTYKLNFARQTVNVFDTEYQNLPAGNDLYVKGGEGSLAVIDLFTDENQLDSLRNTNWLINEANLKFYVNEEQLPGNFENPQRLFIYDVNNEMILKDYAMAGDVKENDVLNSRTTHLGKLKSDDQGSYYKMRITNYINDVINNDSTNTRLGLVVSQNVNIDNFGKTETTDLDISKVPISTVLARNGTVLYGPEAPNGKALKLEIYYTESK